MEAVHQLVLMGDHQHRNAHLAHPLQQLHHFLARLRVNVAGGLVRDDQLGVMYQRTRHSHTLLLAAGKGIRVALGLILQMHQLQNVLHAGTDLLAGHIEHMHGKETGGESDNGGNSSTGTGSGTGTGTGGSSGTGEGGNQPNPETKTYKKVTISGQVPLENYAQLFTSFVQTLRNNNLKIEIKFSASTTVANPLTDNSPTVKSIKESASQLGLLFDPEE